MNTATGLDACFRFSLRVSALVYAFKAALLTLIKLLSDLFSSTHRVISEV